MEFGLQIVPIVAAVCGIVAVGYMLWRIKELKDDLGAKDLVNTKLKDDVIDLKNDALVAEKKLNGLKSDNKDLTEKLQDFTKKNEELLDVVNNQSKDLANYLKYAEDIKYLEGLPAKFREIHKALDRTYKNAHELTKAIFMSKANRNLLSPAELKIVGEIVSELFDKEAVAAIIRGYQYKGVLADNRKKQRKVAAKAKTNAYGEAEDVDSDS